MLPMNERFSGSMLVLGCRKKKTQICALYIYKYIHITILTIIVISRIL